jgi:hypothetical protein
MPKSGRGVTALGSTIGLAWPAAKQTAELLDVSPRWTKFLHHLWVVEQSRAPGLVMRVLADGPNPSLDILRDLASHMFPLECLDGLRKIAVILYGATRGLDTLLQVHDAGGRDLAVYHPSAAALETLRVMYPGSWSFENLPENALALQNAFAGAEAIVVETPAGGSIDYVKTTLKDMTSQFAGRLIVSFDDGFLAAMGYDFANLLELYKNEPGTEKLLTERLGQLLARPVAYRGLYYRHGDVEDSFWFCLELDQSAAPG